MFGPQVFGNLFIVPWLVNESLGVCLKIGTVLNILAALIPAFLISLLSLILILFGKDDSAR